MSDRFNSTVISITPNLASFATSYTSGDVMGAINKVTDAVLDSGSAARLISVVILDAANQKSALDLVFFNAPPAASIGADNAAYGLADSDLSKIIGRVSILQADYVSSGTNNAEATIKNIQLLLDAASGTKNIYMAVVARGAPTYGAATDLIVKLGLEQD